MDMKQYEMMQESLNNQKAIIELLYVIAKASDPKSFEEEVKKKE